MSKRVLDMTDFPIGTRVALKTNHKCLGTVICDSKIDHNKFIIEWDDGEVGSYHSYDSIMLLSDLESDFRIYQEKINSKIKEATDAILEASKMAKEHNVNLSAYDYSGNYDSRMFPAFDEFTDAVDSANIGWSSSSIGC